MLETPDPDPNPVSEPEYIPVPVPLRQKVSVPGVHNTEKVSDTI